MRTALGMTPTQFADLLGVHATTVGRWERTNGAEAVLDPRSQQWLVSMRSKLFAKDSAAPSELGSLLINALLVGGAMYAGYLLLKAMFDEE